MKTNENSIMTYLYGKGYALKLSLKDKNNIDWDDLDMIQHVYIGTSNKVNISLYELLFISSGTGHKSEK